MIGIIATIIAAKKRHYTFAWVVGIWTAIAVVLFLMGMGGLAIAPGWLFLVFALGMKKIPEESNNNVIIETTTYNNTLSDFTVQSQPLVSEEATPVYPAINNEELITIERTSPDPVLAALRFCRYCGQEINSDAKFCCHCGARIE